MEQRRAVVREIVAKQRSDGGWNLASLGNWTRSDGTAQETESDGYATGLLTLALAGKSKKSCEQALASSREWLRTH